MPPTPCRGVVVPASCADGGLMKRPGVEAEAPGVGFGWLGEALGCELLGCGVVLGGVVEPGDTGGDPDVGGGVGEGVCVGGGVGLAMARSLATTACAWARRLAESGR